MAMPYSLEASYAQESNAMGASLFPQRSSINDAHVELLPNPDFVFPALPADGSRPTKRPLSTQLLPTSKRVPRPALAERRSVNALPNFTFNPASFGSAPASSTSTPPRSPTLPSPTSSRPMGHRRGGSELVGGDARFGTLAMVSGSPPKNDAFPLPPPAPSRLGPPPGRRGHAHRRSGAISGHDLQSILQPREPNILPRGGSAPVSPLEAEPKPFFSAYSRRSMSQSSVNFSIEPSVEQGPDSSPQRPGSSRTTRVGFSEKVEYIRPLSTISSETESSLSTIRGHSVTNSLSSVMSGGASSPSPARSGRPSLNTTFEDESLRARPSTAGGVLDAFTSGPDQVLGTASRPNSSYMPMTANMKSPRSFPVVVGSPSPKKRAFFGWEHRRTLTPASPSLHSSASDPSLGSSPQGTAQSATGSEAAAEGKDGKSRKPRKVKSWANSLIRKPKQPQSKSRPQTQPQDAIEGSPDDMDIAPDASPELAPGLSASFLLENFDVDDTVTIVAADDLGVPRLNTDSGSLHSTPRLGPVHDNDLMSPVIDLDAALGPFQTPHTGNTARANRASRRSMHSGALPGIPFQNNHRRTESAPELVPFEVRSGLAPVSTMADVFEEDEEEEVEKDTPKRADSKTITDPIVLEQMDTEKKDSLCDDTSSDMSNDLSGFDFSEINDPTPQNVDNDLSIEPAVLESHRDSMAVTCSEATAAAPVTSPYSLPRDPSPVEVVEPDEEPRAASLTRDSDSTITPPLHPMSNSPLQHPLKSTTTAGHSFSIGLPATAPADHSFALGLPPPPPLPLMTPDSSTSSAFSSPAFSASQLSFETPRLGTATSSMTDGRGPYEHAEGSEHQSMREMMMLLPDGPDMPFRASVDDVPSLTSSRSTATNGPPTSNLASPNQIQFFSPSYGIRPGSSGGPIPRAPLARPASAFTLPYLRDARTGSVCSIGLSARSSLALHATDASTAHAHGHMAHPDDPHDVEMDARRRKRASIVSLSRLMGVGGALGEKSKLSVEHRASDNDVGEKAAMSMDPDARREKRGSRLSRVMKFWKSKETLRP